MDKIILEKAIKQAKANVELETSTPIDEKIIKNYIENVINKQIEKKVLTKKENINGDK